MPFDEKRKFTRVLFETAIKVTAGPTVIVSDRLRDISLGGAFVFTSSNALAERASCVLEIELIGRASLLRVQVEGEVVRVDREGIAVKFTKIDLDSLVHLRHMVKIHARDPQLVDEEYATALLELDSDQTH